MRMGRLAFLWGTVALAGSAGADTLTTIGVGPIPAGSGVDEVVFNGSGVVLTGNAVVGRGNKSQTLYKLDAGEPLEATANGQSEVNADDEFINVLDFTVLDGGTFTRLSFQAQFENTPGSIKITAFESDGGTVSETFQVLSNDQSEKYFTISGDFESLLRVRIESNVVESLREFRVDAVPVPLPAAVWGGFALLGGLGLKRLRRRRGEGDIA